MKAVGIIVEYNPFHNGHAFHLEASRKVTNADIVIAVMSGNFLQRGEPALVSKWYRTKMALLNGVDLVFELPYGFAVQKAETFANGAVSILDAVGCDYLCFGSESGDIDSFYRTIHYLNDEHEKYENNIKQFMNKGVSYPKALALSYQQLPNSENVLDLSRPNNILGFHYIKAIIGQNSSIKPVTVARKNANYHDENFASETIASATSIRKAIFSDDKKINISQYVPEPTKKLLDEYVNHYGMFHHWENYWDYLQFQLIQASNEELQEVYEVEEGLENRMKAAAIHSTSFQEFMQKVKTKRYTWTRLQRLCVHILTNAQKMEMTKFTEKASYLRLLGMTTLGRDYLNQMKKHFSLPLVSKLSSFKGREITFDINAARIYAMGLGGIQRQLMLKQEFIEPPIYIKK
ncbi:nucleotidyltransferase [Neobacillus sedimentimangrovi]|uniref:nucleotidyltransferase n=1 Tax=Neobacillus sedimentimangrovi TaxID=2699460 RepID=UPI0013D24073|nr:nucleotidyltransferase [Neobacillus sedimentimangrovi]